MHRSGDAGSHESSLWGPKDKFLIGGQASTNQTPKSTAGGGGAATLRLEASAMRHVKALMLGTNTCDTAG